MNEGSPGRDSRPTSLRLDGRVAVVTGAGQGLGRSCALELARRGARAVVNDIGGDVHGSGYDDSIAMSVFEEIRGEGGDAVADYHTIATPDGGDAIIAHAIDAYGWVDALVR